MALLLLTIVSTVLGLVLTAISTVAPRTREDNGQLNRVGLACLVVAIITSLANTVISQLEDRKADRERLAADSTSQARTAAVTDRLERVLGETEALRGENERLRALQQLGLHQIDSVSMTSRALALDQERALHDLRSSLDFSRAISDTLRASVALTREMADSLHRIDVRAGERTQATLAAVQRAHNPLTSLRARIHIHIPRTTARQAAVIDRLYATRRSNEQVGPTRSSGRWAVLSDRPRATIFLPAWLELDIWRGDEECNTRYESLLRATRRLDYNSATTRFFTGIAFSWENGEFMLSTDKNLSVDDLNGACVRVGFVGEPMFSPQEIEEFWGTAMVGAYDFVLPQGRRAQIEYHQSHGSEVVAWVGVLRFVN